MDTLKINLFALLLYILVPQCFSHDISDEDSHINDRLDISTSLAVPVSPAFGPFLKEITIEKLRNSEYQLTTLPLTPTLISNYSEEKECTPVEKKKHICIKRKLPFIFDYSEVSSENQNLEKKYFNLSVEQDIVNKKNENFPLIFAELGRKVNLKPFSKEKFNGLFSYIPCISNLSSEFSMEASTTFLGDEFSALMDWSGSASQKGPRN